MWVSTQLSGHIASQPPKSWEPETGRLTVACGTFLWGILIHGSDHVVTSKKRRLPNEALYK